jgi:hypothetical protein
VSRILLAALALSACGPTLTPLTPRGPVPAVVDIVDPETAPVRVASPGAAAAAARADAEYFGERQLMVPVVGVAPTALRDSYNAARSGGRTHRALDIPARRGTPVIAAAEGTILSMRQNTLGGTTLYLLDSQRRFVYYYAHLERRRSAAGRCARVRRHERKRAAQFSAPPLSGASCRSIAAGLVERLARGHPPVLPDRGPGARPVSARVSCFAHKGSPAP